MRTDGEAWDLRPVERKALWRARHCESCTTHRTFCASDEGGLLWACDLGGDVRVPSGDLLKVCGRRKRSWPAEGENGYMVDPEDTKAFAKTIDGIFADGRLAQTGRLQL